MLLSIVGAILQLPLQARPTQQLLKAVFGGLLVVVHVSTRVSAWSMHQICIPLFYFGEASEPNKHHIRDDPYALT